MLPYNNYRKIYFNIQVTCIIAKYIDVKKKNPVIFCPEKQRTF